MRLLLDTHAVLWWLADDPALSSLARMQIQDPENDIFASAATAWEISTKRALGKLDAPENIEQILVKRKIATLPIEFRHAVAAGKLAPLHNDPFDRMLIAQASLEQLVLMTRDARIVQYDVMTTPA